MYNASACVSVCIKKEIIQLVSLEAAAAAASKKLPSWSHKKLARDSTQPVIYIAYIAG